MPSTPISTPIESRTARCRVFSSSRTLPGQRLALSARRASMERGRNGRLLACEYFLMKCCASSPMSAGRSRSGGILRFTTFRRNSRSSRNLPSRTASVRLRFEVAMIRISTGTGRLPPTRSITRSWMARNSLACSRTSISEISSSSSVALGNNDLALGRQILGDVDKKRLRLVDVTQPHRSHCLHVFDQHLGGAARHIGEEELADRLVGALERQRQLVVVDVAHECVCRCRVVLDQIGVWEHW